MAGKEQERAPAAHKECRICGTALDEFYWMYVTALCRGCDLRARTQDGAEPRHNSAYDEGDNPVFVDGKKCWRRYKFGGYVTMLDLWSSSDLREFHEHLMQARLTLGE